MSADQTIPLPNITRIEVIDSTGRTFSRHYEIPGCSVQTQDQGRTLKVFANIPEGETTHATREDRQRIADRLRALAIELGQNSHYFMSYDADFLTEVADLIAPPAPTEGMPHE